MLKAGGVCSGEISASQLELGTKKHIFTAVITVVVEKQFRVNVCLELLTFCFLILNRYFPCLPLVQRLICQNRNEVKSLDLLLEFFFQG